MLYEVTCNQCGVHYRVTTQGGETRRVACPSCRHRMTVAFPLAEKPKRTSEMRKALWAMAVVLVIGLPLAGYGIHTYREREAAERAIAEKQRAERKAHVDSLNAERARQDAEEQAAIRQQAQDERVEQFLMQFYDDTFFGSMSPDDYRESLSERCYQHLLADGDATTDSLAWKRLYPTIPNADREELLRSMRIQAKGEGWYDVSFTSHGMTQTRHLRVAGQRDWLLLDDYR